MRKLQSSSANIFYCSFKYYFLHILYIIIYFLLYISIVDGFDPIIQFPSSGLYRNNDSSSSETLVLNISDFGANGDGITDNTQILQDIWKVACSLPSPAKIVIPAWNSYLVKPVDFAGPCKSNVTLSISGTFVAPQDPTVWDDFDVHKWLYFHGVNNLTIEGYGVIEGMGQEWWAQSCKRNESNPCTHAPTAITFHKCNNLKVREVTLLNSQQMHIAFTNCMDVSVSGVIVVAPAGSPNTDGVHISASINVELEDVIIATGDDCVSIVGNSSQIRIKNIVCGPGHGISLGKYNSHAEVQDIVVDGAILFDTENGVRIKTWQGGSGFVTRITFEDIWMYNVSNPIIIDQYYCDSRVPCLNQTSAVDVDNISFRGIRGTSAKEEAIELLCSESHPCRRLYLEDIQIISLSGIAKSSCWEAYGTSSGLILPPSCISSEDVYRSRKMGNPTRHACEKRRR